MSDTNIAVVVPTKWDWLRPEIDKIIECIKDGVTYREIARTYNVSPSFISDLVNLPEYKEQSARALLCSAESWLDRGLDELIASDPTSANRARYIAQECARRAAIRNPRYRDKVDTAITGTINLRDAKELSDDELNAIASGAGAIKSP